MRPTTKLTKLTKLATLALAATTALGACKWTEFDDLETEAWVDSTTKPGDVKSSDYGIAIARGALGTGAASGGLVVLGAGDATYSELTYNAQGQSSVPKTSVNLKGMYGIPTIATPQTILLADPSSNDISLIVPSDNGIALLTGNQGVLKLYQLFNLAAPDAAAYVLAPTHTTRAPLVAVGENVYGAQLPALADGVAQPSCKLGDGGATPGFKASIKALGTVGHGVASDEVLAWDATGKLFKYAASVFNGCLVTAAPSGSVDVGFQPGPGAQILSIDETHVLVQGHTDTTGFLRVIDVAAMATAGEPATVPGLRSATLLITDGGTVAVVGVPTALVNGKPAGQVVVYKLSTAGVDTVPSAAFNDAQPEANQNFGRGVAAMPYNGKQVLAVAADNEIFVYFRANLADGTPLYAETRRDR